MGKGAEILAVSSAIPEPPPPAAALTNAFEVLFVADSYHTSLSNGEGQQDQEDRQNRSDLDGQAPRLALKANGRGDSRPVPN